MEDQIVNKYKEVFSNKILPVLEQRAKQEIKGLYHQFRVDKAEGMWIFNKQRFMLHSQRQIEEEQKWGAQFLLDAQERKLVSQTKSQKEKLVKTILFVDEQYKSMKKRGNCLISKQQTRVERLIQQNEKLAREIQQIEALRKQQKYN